MPGPGGGSFGGGGSRGGGGGGGGYSGGRGGSGSHGYSGTQGRIYRYPSFTIGGGPRRPGQDEGCLKGCLSGLIGGIFGLVCIPLIIIAVCVFLIFGPALFSSGFSLTKIAYDENAFQEYADTQYAAEFGGSTAYEDNILLVFLAEDENYYDYYYIAWVGDHVATDINHRFGNENTALGYAVGRSVNAQSYKYSLDSNLANVVEIMEEYITSNELNTSFKCEETHIQVPSHLVNKTAIELNEETVNTALTSFTDTTGIPMAVVVEDIDQVFKRSINPLVIVIGIIALAILAVVVFLIVRKVRKRKAEEQEDTLADT